MKKKYIFILANASLELIPKSIWRYKSVLRWARFRRKPPKYLILDSTLHHPAIKRLSDYRDRGRPDILHRALLLITDSLLNREGYVESIIIHTRNNDVFWVNPEIRPPRHYIRFLGLFEKLLIEKQIVTEEGKILIRYVGRFEDYLRSLQNATIVILSKEGERESIPEFVRKLDPSKKLVFIVGAQPHGPLPEYIVNIANYKLSLGSYDFSTTYVLCKLISSLEFLHEL